MKKFVFLILSCFLFTCSNPQAPESEAKIELIHMSPLWEFSSSSPDSSIIGIEYRLQNISLDSISGWEAGFTFVYHDGVNVTFIDKNFRKLGPDQIIVALLKRRIGRSDHYQKVFLEFLSSH